MNISVPLGRSLVFVVLAVSLAGYLSQIEAESECTANLSEFLQHYVKKRVGDNDSITHYSMQEVSLIDDSARQTIVYLTGHSWCGSGGCTMLILDPKDHSCRVLTETTVTRLPIRVLDHKTNGWHDIGVWVQGGGIQKGYEAVLSFNGTNYPSNPTSIPARSPTSKPPGRTVISTKTKSILLFK